MGQATNGSEQNEAARNKHVKKKEYLVGYWIYLKLQSYRQTSMAIKKSLKIAARYYWHFEIIECIGPMAYKLCLTEGS